MEYPSNEYRRLNKKLEGCSGFGKVIAKRNSVVTEVENIFLGVDDFEITKRTVRTNFAIVAYPAAVFWLQTEFYTQVRLLPSDNPRKRFKKVVWQRVVEYVHHCLCLEDEQVVENFSTGGQQEVDTTWFYPPDFSTTWFRRN